MSANFVHLRVHSDYSLVDGLARIKPLAKAVASGSMPAVALTDLSNFFALIKFYKAAIAAGVKPIFGADILVEADIDDADPVSLSLLICDQQGYRNLIELISLAYQKGQSRGRAIVKRQWLEAHAMGLIALSCGLDGDIGRALNGDRDADAERLLAYWMSVFPERFYIELQRTGKMGEERYIHAAVVLADKHECPLVASNNVRFISADEFEAHETRVCIHEGRTLDDPRRPKRYTEQQYLRSADEMQQLFSDIPDAIENTVEIAKRCNLSLVLGEHCLPDYPIPEGMDMAGFFCQLSHTGLDTRLEQLFDASADDFIATQKLYRERLDFELNVILQMGFPGYFLIVMDFIQWAKDHAVPVGPGRGSGAGSLVAYALKITDLDPIAYDLLFERFLNPERVSMPDFDIDFCMEKRDLVINYVAEHYGRDAVSQIITFGTMAAKAVVRDVARVQGKSYGLADKLSKMIPFEVGMTLEKAYEQEEEIRSILKHDEQAEEIWDMALRLEGVTRNVGKHAGGVVIAPTQLTDFSPVYCDETGDGLVTQYDKNDVEDAGLVKFDFLGLRTLTIIDWAKKIIDKQRAVHGEEPLLIEDIPLDDKQSFELLQSAETTAVFQLESRGMKDLIKRLLPSRFEDIVALVALFRPGPLQSGMVDDFINRKHGRAELAYPHPKYQHKDLQPVLEPTYGIILYQEQVMQIAQVMAGYSLGEADLLRRAMGKKKPEEMAKQREIFLEGSIKNDHPKELANNIFDLMEKFAGYGFNKSHSAAYALVSYHTLWLKTHYPAPFMAAVLSSEIQNTDKIVVLIEECRAMKLNLQLPDVNQGDYLFTVNDNNDIIYGLGAIKGLGEGPIESIIAAREKEGPFKNLFDFCQRTDSRKVNKRALEALIRSGSFDGLGVDRSILMASLPEAVKAAEQSASNSEAGIGDLFGEVVVVSENEDVYANAVNVRPWNTKERLQGEKETLGLYVTGHPFDDYESEIRRFVPTKIVELRASNSPRVISGLIVSMRTMRNKRGDNMAFVLLDDRSARIEVTLFSDVYEHCKQQLSKDAVMIVEGTVSHDDYSGQLKMVVKSAQSLLSARETRSKGLAINIARDAIDVDFVKQLKRSLNGYLGGKCPLVVNYAGASASATLRFDNKWQVQPNDELIQRLRDEYGAESVHLLYDSA